MNRKPISRALALDPNNARGLCALGNWYYVDARTLRTAAAAIRRDVQRELHALLQQSEITDPFLHHVGRTVTDRIVAAYAELGEWRRMLADLPTVYLGLAVDPRYSRLMRVAGMEDMM